MTHGPQTLDPPEAASATGVALVALAMRSVMETAVVIAFATWGYSLGDSVMTRLILAALFPLIGFGLWGIVDFRTWHHAEVLRCVEELVISGVAAVSWYVSGQHALGAALLAWSVAYHVFVYATGQRLLKPA